MKNPHNPDVDILRLKPLYNGSTYIYVGMYGSRISRYSERVLQGGYNVPRPPGKVKDVGNCQKRCVAQVTVLEEPVRGKYVRGSNAEVNKRLVTLITGHRG